MIDQAQTETVLFVSLCRTLTYALFPASYIERLFHCHATKQTKRLWPKKTEKLILINIID